MADDRGMPEPVTRPEPPAAIAWLGHSTLVLDVGGVRLLTDPLLRRNNWPLRRRGGRPAAGAWTDVDAVLLSHLHHDHAELSSLRLLPGVPVLTAPENAAWLRRKGIEARDDLGEDWVDVGGTGVRVRLVRADHHNRPMPHRPNAANGHLVRAPGLSVWLAGDTSLYPRDDATFPGSRAGTSTSPSCRSAAGGRGSPGAPRPRAGRPGLRRRPRRATPYPSTGAPCTRRCSRTSRAGGWTARVRPSPRRCGATRRSCRPIVLRPGEARTLDLGPRDGSAGR